MKSHKEKLVELDNALKSFTDLISSLRSPVFAGDLSKDELHTFAYIAENGNKSMKELAQYLSVKPNVMTGIVLGLKNKQMVTRYECFKDRRVVMVEVAPKWQQIYNMFRKELEKNSQMIIESVGEKNIDSLQKLLSEMTTILNEKIPMISKTV